MLWILRTGARDLPPGEKYASTVLHRGCLTIHRSTSFMSTVILPTIPWWATKSNGLRPRQSISF
jgi:hypothetical protein